MKKLKNIISLLSLSIAVHLLTGCSSADVLSQVFDKEWIVTAINGKILEESKLENGLPRLKFSIGNKLAGFTGCNTFNGSYKREGNSIYLEAGAITKMMCYDTPEFEFLRALKEVTTMKLNERNLYLQNDVKIIMTLVPAEE